MESPTIDKETLKLAIHQDDKISSKKSLKLPEPDQGNITVLSHNLPNTPIIPNVLKESVNAVLRLFRRKHTQSND